MKIIVGMVNHETNSFNIKVSDKQFFEQILWAVGDQVECSLSDGQGDYLGGMVAEARLQGVQVVHTMACVQCGGIITKDCYSEILHNLTSVVTDNLDADGVCLALHGAGISQTTNDIEGDILQHVRKLVGDKPIYITCDLHANISDDMVKYADAIFAVKEYPHTDCYDTGKKTMKLLIDSIRNNKKIYSHFVRMPLNISPANAATNVSPSRDIKQLCDSLEGNGVQHVGFFHGFPSADVPFMSCGVLVVADERQKAIDNAITVANFVWEIKDQYFAETDDEYSAIDSALKKQGMVVVNDTSDNPGGGAPGDNTYLLKALLERNVEQTCYGFMYDEEVARMAHEAGVGKKIDINLGGKVTKVCGKPIVIKNAYVKCLTDGTFKLTTPMYKGVTMPLGLSARLVVGNVDIIVTSFPFQTLDEQVFLLHGIDITQYKIVALKGTMHFKARFADFTDNFVTADTVGVSTSRLENLPYQHRVLDFYPIVKDIRFKA